MYILPKYSFAEVFRTEQISRIRKTPNLLTDADSSTAAKKLLSQKEKKKLRPPPFIYLFILFIFFVEGGCVASNSEHLPVFKAPREGNADAPHF